MSTTTKKPWPICSCGSNRVFACGSSNAVGKQSFYCRECMMESPVRNTKDDAIDAWNLMVAAPLLLNALKSLQWGWGQSRACKECLRSEADGFHSEDCKIGLAIAQAEGRGQ